MRGPIEDNISAIFQAQTYSNTDFVKKNKMMRKSTITINLSSKDVRE